MARDMTWNSVDLLVGILREGTSETADLLIDKGATLELVELLIASAGDAFCDGNA